MLNKEQAKEKLKKLVTDFKNNPDYYKKLSEPDVEDKLVSELFVNILGWDKKDYEKRPKVRRGNDLRKIPVEPVYGNIKQNPGFRKFTLRGLEKVKIEINLACIAHNLQKIRKQTAAKDC